MAPPVIPDKPLACYPKAGETTQPATPPAAQCTSASVLKTWEKESKDYDAACGKAPRCPNGEEQKLYYQQSDGCHRILRACYDRQFTLPVVARNLGVTGAAVHLRTLAPHLGANLDDLRSAEVMLKAASSSELTDLMKAKRTINVGYPASGSHLGPLEIVFSGIDRGLLDSARLTYTEIDAKAEGRVREYLRHMASPAQGIISNLRETSREFKPGRETTFSFTYRGKPIQLVFATNRGGDLWIRDEVVKDANLVIFHDSVYNNPFPKGDKPMDRFIKHLHGLTAKDGRKRLVLTENAWGKKCETSGKCAIGKHSYPAQAFHGYYGCGYTSAFSPTPFRMVDGRLVEDPKSPLKKGHVHTGPHDIITRSAILLTVAK